MWVGQQEFLFCFLFLNDSESWFFPLSSSSWKKNLFTLEGKKILTIVKRHLLDLTHFTFPENNSRKRFSSQIFPLRASPFSFFACSEIWFETNSGVDYDGWVPVIWMFASMREFEWRAGFVLRGCIATLLNCYTATLLHCYTATLLHYYTASLLHCYTATLLHYYTTTLLHCYTATLRHWCAAVLCCRTAAL